MNKVEKARLLGINRNTLHNWEKGTQKYKLAANYMKLAEWVAHNFGWEKLTGILEGEKNTDQ